MPLSQAQMDVIAKMDGGTAIIDQIDTDLEAVQAPLKEQNARLTRENVERKRMVQEYKEHMKKANLDPEKPLAEQIEDLQEKIKGDLSKGMKPSSEVEAILKKMEKIEKDFAASKQEAENLKAQNRREKASSAFAPKLPEIFGKAAPLVLKNALADGLITVNDAGEPCVKNADGELVTGDAAIVELKRIHADLVITNQRTGSGNTPANGGRADVNSMTATRAEFEAMPLDKKGEFYKKGGRIE